MKSVYFIEIHEINRRIREIPAENNWLRLGDLFGNNRNPLLDITRCSGIPRVEILFSDERKSNRINTDCEIIVISFLSQRLYRYDSPVIPIRLRLP